ncbi:sugar phosphate isomerase/epimerase family protein [Aquibacillus albus]|uniref:Xylose isomerase n=1 Tax=Aquibacillus albus TaxID=1168171 RepID=A0ABS2MWK5_9BACI|nr:sugar phosphate isomerase/epimerase [Aquibacillus albus]MBM7570158.1 xylose isomerase [Aquibacillus albus]
MSKLKNSIIVGILGRYADRFHEFQPARTFLENLEVARNIPGIEGLEVVYPQDFVNREESIQAIKDTGLPVSAVNLNIKSEKKWKKGSFTNPDPKLRAEAVQYLKDAMDLAAELGTDMVTTCPLMDGHDYNFHVDFSKQWKWLRETITEGASYRTDIKVSLEYKAFESKSNIILADMGRTLHLCNQTGLDNVGVTMDVGHALIAQENPAEMACIAADANRLFYVHFNDNNRGWDWDMIPGAVNIWDLVETLFYLDKINWSGWLTYDVFTKDGDPAEAFEVTFNIMEAAQYLLEKLGKEEIQELIDEGVPAKTYDFLFKQLVGKQQPVS